jgi:16S rRNA (guanine527-N7)-methyltransferase
VGERFVSVIASGAEALGVALPPDSLAGFEIYFKLLTEKNADYNLTAIKGEEDTARLHFLDAIAILALPGLRGGRLLDIGSGAGFPGLVLAIARPELSVTLLDAREKRVDFLREVVRALGLGNVECAAARAEEFVKTRRASYDVVTARAVARLNILCELGQPFLRPGGVLIAPKGADTDEEIRDARRAAAILGGELETVAEYILPGEDAPRRAAVVRQTAECPERYPRRWAAIQRTGL